MLIDYIIIGQGISGTWLSYYLMQHNKSILVFDKQNLQSASNVAGGLINPVTGRRVVTTWMADELMPFVWNEYNAISEVLHERFIHQKNSIVFPFAPDLQQAFAIKMNEENGYIKKPALQKETLTNAFNFPFDVFEITPCYVVQMRALLEFYRQMLIRKQILFDETFDENLVGFKNDFIQYKHIKAKKIIYADGIQAAQSKFWVNLPFVQNKGQALIVDINDLNKSYVYKFGHTSLVHTQENLWWAGSSNELAFQDEKPTEDFFKRTLAQLKSVLKKEFTVKEHWSSLRPATVERRPFVGFHPLYKQIGILNGMGSKGCSLAPWFAKEFVAHIVHDKPISALADVRRFSKVLSKN